MIQIREQFLPRGHPNRPGQPMDAVGILFHSTNNWSDGAGDEMHSRYLLTTDRSVSWHVTVDKNSATQHIPFNENAWHAGDGENGYYNRNWIGVEIACEAVDRGDPLDAATYQNAVDVIAQIMIDQGISGWDQLQPHFVVYGKDCPHHSLFDRDQFKRDVFSLMEKRKEEESGEAMSPQDANKIIRFLSAAWFATEVPEAREEFHRLANELRKASGQPVASQESDK